MKSDSHPARGRGRGDFSNSGQRGRGQGDYNNFTGNRGRGSNYRGRGFDRNFDNGFNIGRGGSLNQRGNNFQSRGGFGGGYSHLYEEDNTEYDTQGYDDMDLEQDNEDYQEQSAPDWRGPQGNNLHNDDASSSSSSSIRPGDWRCKQCGEINFARREKCRKCGCDKNFEPPKVSDNNHQGDGGDTLENFDKMFENWESTYNTWREENRNNPDQDYVSSYTKQMEAMRTSLMEKRRKMERSQAMFRSWNSDNTGGIPGLDPDTVTNTESEKSADQPPLTSDVVNRILDDNDYDDSDDDNKEETKQDVRPKKSRWGDTTDHEGSDEPRIKKSRWEVDPEDTLDIAQMRRRPGGPQQHFQPRPSSGPPRPVLLPNQGPPMSVKPRGPVFGQNRFPPQRPGFNNHQQQQHDDFEQFWKPSEVKDYSQSNEGGRFSQERDFRPQTFDYSHGGGQGRGGGSHGRQGQSRFSPAPVASASPAKPSGTCVMIDSILTGEGRRSRPPKMVIILRGLPGAGKSHLAKLIKDREMEAGGEKMRTMCLDDYFDVDGIYEYEPEMEESYRASFLKSFKKTVDGNLFSIILVDAVHNKVSQFREFWSYAKQNGFEVCFLVIQLL